MVRRPSQKRKAGESPPGLLWLNDTSDFNIGRPTEVATLPLCDVMGPVLRLVNLVSACHDSVRWKDASVPVRRHVQLSKLIRP